MHYFVQLVTYSTLDEKSILIRAKHRFVVRLKYTSQDEERLYFVMEYLAGGINFIILLILFHFFK